MEFTGENRSNDYISGEIGTATLGAGYEIKFSVDVIVSFSAMSNRC